MTNRLFALALALLFTLPPSAPASAATPAPAADWSAVQSLSPGQKIIVRTKDGDRLSGRFDSANDLLINFTDGRRKVSLTRESVKLVQLDRGNSRGRGALFGALIGGAAGFAVGSVLYFPYRDDMVGSTVPASAALGAAVGVAVGTATGKGNKNETVYEAP
ncbi:MAG TPA: hypothetical protein VF586_10405 [Pyrinomonadaceae bacterium]|jgi:hypothetical protein